MSPTKQRLLNEVSAGLTTHFKQSISAADLKRLPVKSLERLRACVEDTIRLARQQACVRQPWQ